jgi:hypothetical protein
MLFLKTTVRNNVFCARFYCALLTICFGPDWWPSSGNMYIKYTKVTTMSVNGSVEIADLTMALAFMQLSQWIC